MDGALWGEMRGGSLKQLDFKAILQKGAQRQTTLR